MKRISVWFIYMKKAFDRFKAFNRHRSSAKYQTLHARFAGYSCTVIPLIHGYLRISLLCDCVCFCFATCNDLLNVNSK